MSEDEPLVGPPGRRRRRDAVRSEEPTAAPSEPERPESENPAGAGPSTTTERAEAAHVTTSAPAPADTAAAAPGTSPRLPSRKELRRRAAEEEVARREAPAETAAADIEAERPEPGPERPGPERPEPARPEPESEPARPHAWRPIVPAPAEGPPDAPAEPAADDAAVWAAHLEPASLPGRPARPESPTTGSPARRSVEERRLTTPTGDGSVDVASPLESTEVRRSRRSMRDRLREAPSEPPTDERERTGRRPVVRAPAVAQGVRGLDETGQLTGVQPVVRDEVQREHARSAPERHGAPPALRRSAPSVESTGSIDPTSWNAATMAPEADEDPEHDDDAPLRPTWVSVSAVGPTGEPADQWTAPLRPGPTRASRRQVTAEDLEGRGPEVPVRRPTASAFAADLADAPAPSVVATAAPELAATPEPVAGGGDVAETSRRPGAGATVLKIAALALAAAVIAALVWILASGAIDAAAGAAAAAGGAVGSTFTVIDHHEESRAR
ncbi:hypothetical protein [Georgenia faecalis]|uniref:Uncharacterized protein n=1 Tax=Georgenia faecalis TaxID=2483799 RepID=A0ABV9DC01_9MICO|nr:hypothetical protein [Georgenia faecalis]